MFLIQYHYCHLENNHGQAGSRSMGYAKTKSEGLRKIKVLAKTTATDKADLIKSKDPKENKFRLWVNDEATGWVLSKLPSMYKLAGHEDDFMSGDEAEVRQYAEKLIMDEASNNPLTRPEVEPKLKWKKKELFDSDYPTGLSIVKVW